MAAGQQRTVWSDIIQSPRCNTSFREKLKIKHGSASWSPDVVLAPVYLPC